MPAFHGAAARVTHGNPPWRRASDAMRNPADGGTAQARLHCIFACKLKSCPVQTGASGGIIVSLALHSDTEAQAAVPSRRSALRGVPQPTADSVPVTESAAEPPAVLIAPGWYADPAGSAQCRWWDGTAWTARLSGETALESAAEGALGVVAEAAVVAETAVVAPVAPLSRRQLRELVGALTTAPVLSDADALSPVEALSESPPAESESADVPAPVQPAPTAPPTPIAPTAPPADPPLSAVTFSRGALGFRLPPDPFATLSAAVDATPQPFVSRSPTAVVPGAVFAISARSTTAAVWLFALLPVVHAAAVWLIFGLLDLGANPVIHYSVLAAPLLLYPVLAFVDGRELRGRGFSRTASAVLALAPPLYLLVRAIRVGAAGLVPLLLSLLLQAAAFSFLLLQLPAVFALVPLSAPGAATPGVVISSPITDAQRAAELTPSGMAAELTRQTLAKNLAFSSISCPLIPVTLDGTSVSCVGTLASVKMKLTVVIDSAVPNSAFVLVSEAPAV